MADVRPILATHYDLDVVGSLQRVAAPPYDVIDAAKRAELLGRSPYNAVAIDLPKPYGETGPQQTEDDPYERAARTMDAWREAGALVDDSEPAIWAMTQDYTGPDGTARTRHGILARVRVEDFEAGPGPAPRAHPARAEEGPARPDPRHPAQPLADLLAQHQGPLAAGRAGDRAAEPWGEATDEGGTVTRVWRVGDPAIHAAVTELLAGAQLLIADGHHRYETAIAYRDEVGGEGDPQLHADGADRARRPRPHRLPHPPPALRLRRRPRAPAAARRGPARALRRRPRSRSSNSTRSARRASASSASTTPTTGTAFRLRLKDSAIAALDQQLAGKPEAYRRLDAAILETLVLKGIAGMSEDDILAKRGLGYAKSVEDSLALLEDGAYDVAFILRPIPVDQVRRSAKATRTCRPSRPTSSPRSSPAWSSTRSADRGRGLG